MNPEKVRSFLQRKIESGAFTGCSLIFGQGQRKIIELHEGNLGKSLPSPITSKTSFDLQSITKAIVTAPLLYKLMQDGRLKLDDKIGPFLIRMGISNQEMSEITFLDLLTHSSGLSDADLAGTFQSSTDLWKHMFAARPHFEAGTNIEYTDLGYRILGRIIENLMETDLETAAQANIWKPLGLANITYRPTDLSQVAATPDAHGFIDDEQVHFLGGILGCDGVFSNADDLFRYMSSVVASNPGLLRFLNQTKRTFNNPCSSFFDALAVGAKCAGWEVNPNEFSYSGKFHSSHTFEKAGGAGTFIWLDEKSKYIFVYLTNHGKPKPFDDQSWNKLLSSVAPLEVSNLIYEAL